MAKALSLKMADDIFDDTEKVLKRIRMPRNAYINRAVAFYNTIHKRLLTKKRFQKDVALLRGETQGFLKSFDDLQDIPE